MCFKTRCGSTGILHFKCRKKVTSIQKCRIKVTRKVHISEKSRKNVGSILYFLKKEKKKDMVRKNIDNSYLPCLFFKNRTTSRFEAHLVYKHTQKPNFLISNAR